MKKLFLSIVLLLPSLFCHGIYIPELGGELVEIEQGERDRRDLCRQGNCCNLPGLVEQFVLDIQQVVNRSLQHHNAHDSSIRQQETDFEQVVRVNAKQNEGRSRYGIDDEPLTTNHLSYDDKADHQRGAQNGRRKTRDKGIKPDQGQ